MTDTLTLQEVADELGVHYMTVYRYVRVGILPAQRMGRSWQVLRTDLEAFASTDAPRTPRGEADWVGRFTNRIVASDEAGAWQVIEAALSAGKTIPDAYVEIIVPSLVGIGELWVSGQIDVATEHAASEVVKRIVGRIGPRMTRRGVRRGMIVIGSTATELHTLPLAILADLFRSAQFEVVDLGAFLPAEAFAAFVERTDDVVAVCVGVTTRGQDDEISETIAALRGVTSAPILLGGAGIDEENALRLGADQWARTADQAVRIVEDIIAEPPA